MPPTFHPEITGVKPPEPLARIQVHRAILDKGVRVMPGARIGVDRDEDQAREFVVSEAGVTCVAKDTVVGGQE